MIAEVLVGLGRWLVKDFRPAGREYFARRAWNPTRYDRSTLGGPEIEDNERRVVELIEKYAQDAQRTVEFGCGPGDYLKAVAKYTPAPEIVGVDVSAKALELAKRRVNDPRLHLVQGDFWADLEIDQADVVICVGAIHHLGRVREVIDRLRTFVKPGGVLIGNVWTMDHYHEYQRNVHGSLRHLGRSVLFLANAIALRATDGRRFRWGSYRSQILYSHQVDDILRDLSEEILYRSNTRYITGFAIRC